MFLELKPPLKVKPDGALFLALFVLVKQNDSSSAIAAFP